MLLPIKVDQISVGGRHSKDTDKKKRSLRIKFLFVVNNFTLFDLVQQIFVDHILYA